MASFLAHGHEYHLYTYDAVSNVPPGAVIKDANEILPKSSIFKYRDHDSYAGFANCFRYKLLLERGGWWADTDVICLRPFDFTTDHVFSSESDGLAGFYANNGVIKAPRGSKVMARAWDVCQSKNPALLVWGETGPGLMRQIVTGNLSQYIQAPEIFCPLNLGDWNKMLEPGGVTINPASYSIHLWNKVWTLDNRQSKNALYAPDCLYEQLKVKHLSQEFRRRLEAN